MLDVTNRISSRAFDLISSSLISSENFFLVLTVHSRYLDSESRQNQIT